MEKRLTTYETHKLIKKEIPDAITQYMLENPQHQITMEEYIDMMESAQQRTSAAIDMLVEGLRFKPGQVITGANFVDVIHEHMGKIETLIQQLREGK